MKFKDKNGWKHYKNNYNDDTGISGDTINTCSWENCISDEISCNLRQSDKVQCRRRSNKSTHTESKKLNECSRTKCYVRRVRHRISRGVQTVPTKKLSQKVKRKVVNLLKFKWCSKKDCEKRNQEFSEIASSETPTELEKSIKVINKPQKNSGRDDNFPDTMSINTTSDRNDKETKETPAQTNGDNNSPNKNYNRKYDFSVDGTNIEIIRTEKSSVGENNSKPPIKLTDPSSRVNPEDKRRNIRKKRRARSKRTAEKATAVDEKNLSVPEEGSPSQIDERKGNKSNTSQETVRRKAKVVNKTVRINEPKELRSTNNRASNSTEKDAAPPTRGKIDEPAVVSAIEKPATKEGTAEREEESASPSSFKSFNKRVQKSFASRRLSNEESNDEGRRNNYVPRSEPISKQLDAKRNEIADVKNRLDACIADLNDIIFNLSKVFQEIPAQGSGPAGEGALSDRSRQGRSRVH